MTEKLMDLRNMTVGDLRRFLEGLPDDLEITVAECGSTGFVDKVEIERCEYGNGVRDLYIDIYAESGFH